MDLVRYVQALRRRWPVVLLAVLVASAAGALTAEVTSLQRTSAAAYHATAYLEKDRNLAKSLKTLAYYSRLQPVVDRVAGLVGATPSEVAGRYSVVPHPEKGVLEIGATAVTPRAATTLADAAARGLTGFVTQRRHANIRRSIFALRAEAEALTAAGAPSAVVRPLKLEIARKRAALTTPVGLQILQPAVASPVATGPLEAPRTRMARTLAAGALGFVAGLVLILVLERFDSRLRTSRELDDLSSLPLLAEIPPLRSRGRRGIAVSNDPRSKAASAFHVAAASIVSQLPGRGPAGDGQRRQHATILVTSAQPGEGRTTLVANLAVSLAQQGNRVTAISADLRRPGLHEPFGLPPEPGLLQFLTGEMAFSPVGVPGMPAGLRVLPSGGTFERPVELLAGTRMRGGLEHARSRADVVLIDAPALLGTGDALPLVQQVDGVVLVVRAGRVRFDVVDRVLDLLRIVGAPVLGVVLNSVREQSASVGPIRRERDVIVEAVR